MSKPVYDPTTKQHNIAIESRIYEELKRRYPYANLKALVNHILAEELNRTA